MRTLVRTSILVAVLLFMVGLPWGTLLGSGADWPLAARIAGTVVFAGVFVGLPLFMYLGHRRDGQDWAARAGDTLLGVVWVLFVWSLLGRALEVALLPVGDPLRSRIVAGLVLLAAGFLLVRGYREAMRVPRVREVEVRVSRLGEELDGTKLVVVSDTHFGPIDRTRWSEQLAAAVNALDPDIVAHAGDIADGTAIRRKNQAAPLGTVQSRLAKVYVTGNHEYFSEAQGWLDQMAALDWEPLHNRHIVVQRGSSRLVLAGVDDATALASGLPTHGADLAHALDGVDADLPVILLAHQPKQVHQAIDAVDLQISGHTHGGQIWPFHYLVRLEQGFVHGLSSHGERTQLYVTRGSGFWGPPFRIFAPSEITLITLRR